MKVIREAFEWVWYVLYLIVKFCWQLFMAIIEITLWMIVFNGIIDGLHGHSKK